MGNRNSISLDLWMGLPAACCFDYHPLLAFCLRKEERQSPTHYIPIQPGVINGALLCSTIQLEAASPAFLSLKQKSHHLSRKDWKLDLYALKCTFRWSS